MTSTKYDPACPETAAKGDAPTWPLLITAAGRSGTLFTASLLNRLGMRVSHDNRFDPMRGTKRPEGGPLRDGAVSWVYAFSDKDKGYPKWAGGLGGGRFAKVFLQLRHPLKVIGSRTAAPFGDKTRTFIERHSELPSNHPTYAANMRQSLHHWVYWTDFISRVADWSFKLEEIDVRQICEKAGLDHCPEPHLAEQAVQAMKTAGVNHLDDYYPVTWEVLFRVDGEMAARAKKMACDFGYDCDVPTPTVPSPSVPEAEKLVGYYGYPMVACARVQNQGPYLREWLEFHIAAGVAKFYIHYDESEDDTLDILEDYTKKDERVRIFHVPKENPGYDHRGRCAEDNVDRGRWMLFLEPDEFVFSAHSISLSHHLQINCTDALRMDVGLKLFGASGHRVRPSDRLVIESYDKWNMPSGRAPSAVLLNMALCEQLLGGSCSLRALQERSPPASEAELSCAGGVLGNKYGTKSVEEFLARVVQQQRATDSTAELAWQALILRLGYNLLRMEDTEAAFTEAIEKTPDLSAEGKRMARSAFDKALGQVQLDGSPDNTISKYIPLVKSVVSPAQRSVDSVAAQNGGAQVASADAAHYVIPGSGPPQLQQLTAPASLASCPNGLDATKDMDDPSIRPANPQDVTFRFLHIPKTGGTSMNFLLKAAGPLAHKSFCELPTKRLTRRHTADVYQTCDIVSGEFDASHRFQNEAAATGPVYDFVFLRDPMKRVISQYEHHSSHHRFDEETDSWDVVVKRLVTEGECERDQARFCSLLADPDKCLGGGWCGAFRNHQTEVMAGARLYSPQLRASIRETPEQLLCVAERQMQEMSFVGVTEHYNVSVCLFFYSTGWTGLFDECCGQGVSEGLTCDSLNDKLTANVRDSRASSKVAKKHTANYATKFLERDDVMRAIVEGNSLDCQLYKYGVERFIALVHRMEDETGIQFFADGNDPATVTASCQKYLPNLFR